MPESLLEKRFWRYWLGGLLIFAGMIAVNPWLANAVSPSGIMDHQSAASAMRVNAIQSAWQSANVMTVAKWSMVADLIFIIVYSFGAYCGGRLFAQSERPSLRRLGRVVVIAAILFLVTDYVETLCQFVQAFNFRGSDTLAGIAATAQPIKTTAFLTSFVGLLVALILRRTSRRDA